MVSGKFVVMAKVRHPQRMNDQLVEIWLIIIAKRKAEIFGNSTMQNDSFQPSVAWAVKLTCLNRALMLLAFSSTLRHGTGYMKSWRAPKLNARGSTTNFCQRSTIRKSARYRFQICKRLKENLKMDEEINFANDVRQHADICTGGYDPKSVLIQS